MAGFLAAGVGPQIAQMIFEAACIATAAIIFVSYPPIRQVD